MKLKKRSYLIISILIICLVLIFIFKLSGRNSLIQKSQRPNIVIGTLSKGDVQKSESLTGDLLPNMQTNIYSRVNGNIQKNYVDIGTRVLTGQLLALIDTTIYSQNVNQAYANYLQAQANYQNTNLSYERNKILLEKNLVSRQELDNSKTSSDIAYEQQQVSEALYNNAVTQFSYCKITAPFSGTITKRNFDPGSYVTASSNAQGSVLFVLMNFNKIKTVVNVPERTVPFLQDVKDVTITADAYPDKKFNAKISKISESVDLTTRTMPVDIEIDNPESLLKPGMFATVQFITDTKSNSDILPNQIVLNDEKGDFVYVVNPDTTVSKKYILIGDRMNDKLEVLSGLTETDQIVIVGQTLIRDNMKVNITK